MSNNSIKSNSRLFAISLLDGRNWEKVEIVSRYFSEFALIRYRVLVEIKYLIFLSQKTKIVRKLTNKEIQDLNTIIDGFDETDAAKIKKTEKMINHDVKAVEYFLRNEFIKKNLSDLTGFIHFGLTSYDINIPAYALMLTDFNREVISPYIQKILIALKKLIMETKEMVMLARTHGQPALPTTMGKELAVYYQRLQKEKKMINDYRFEGKLNGAVGNFNALVFTCPREDWLKFSRDFILSLGLAPNLVTTQILPYDSWLVYFDSVKRINYILLGLVVDIWWYISFEYFLQKRKVEEVGSSTMSHKINPITFENAEGNLGFANSQWEFFVRKLSVSRLQRDLSDSTIKRDFGLTFGFTLLAWDSLLSGFTKITPNPGKMEKDLENHWEIYAEGIQTYLRNKGFKDAFELMKEKTRGKTFNKEAIYKLIDSLPVTDKDKQFLKIKNLKEYLGLAVKLADLAVHS